jgi:DNA-binding LytR/AlgR family response regulator
MIKCLVVDDEQHAIDILVHYIKQTPFLELVDTTLNPIEGLQIIASKPIDLIFLDIQMPEISGIDFIKAIGNKSKVILTTAYTEFAVEGFDLEVIDYLLKPISMPRFLAATQKALKLIHPSKEEGELPDIEDDYLFVKTESKGKMLKINLADIDYIEGMKNYVAIYRNGQKILVYTNMKDLEERLPQKQFMRVHKSFIIPITKITGIEGNLIALKNVNAEILLGESYKPAFMAIIKSKLVD